MPSTMVGVGHQNPQQLLQNPGAAVPPAPGARANPTASHCLRACFDPRWEGMTQRDQLHINDAY